jgi:hypothetical protein
MRARRRSLLGKGATTDVDLVALRQHLRSKAIGTMDRPARERFERDLALYSGGGDHPCPPIAPRRPRPRPFVWPRAPYLIAPVWRLADRPSWRVPTYSAASWMVLERA